METTKKEGGVPLRVVDDVETNNQVLKEFHDTLLARHKGVWATYHKIKERYWWKGLYKNVEEFVVVCTECQLQPKVGYRDG